MKQALHSQRSTGQPEVKLPKQNFLNHFLPPQSQNREAIRDSSRAEGLRWQGVWGPNEDHPL